MSETDITQEPDSPSPTSDDVPTIRSLTPEELNISNSLTKFWMEANKDYLFKNNLPSAVVGFRWFRDDDTRVAVINVIDSKGDERPVETPNVGKSQGESLRLLDKDVRDKYKTVDEVVSGPP